MIYTVNELIEYLIKHSGEIGDLVVSYTTHEGEMVVCTNIRDAITSLGMLSYSKEMMMRYECECEEDE